MNILLRSTVQFFDYWSIWCGRQHDPGTFTLHLAFTLPSVWWNLYSSCSDRNGDACDVENIPSECSYILCALMQLLWDSGAGVNIDFLCYVQMKGRIPYHRYELPSHFRFGNPSQFIPICVCLMIPIFLLLKHSWSIWPCWTSIASEFAWCSL